MMMDREKVIKDWEAVLSRDPLDAPWDLIDDTLTLLKEQPEIVRCVDCKWHTMIGEMLLCKAQDKPHTYDWFCADGGQKEVK